ncbi:MAG: DUF2088 domain-containing protein [Planctomycetaceae bacterium]|nr:DUF2088 domain-containing protein [Planctomycetaceae bacterium]
MSVTLNYGYSGRFSYEVKPDRIVAFHAAPAPCRRVDEAVRSALATPLDFPPFEQLCVPGDRVTLALDRHTPAAIELIAELWKALSHRGVEAADVLILQPAALDGVTLGDPRLGLPEEVRAQVRWSIHDPTDAKQQTYLATTARNERIYLARDVTEVEVVVSVGAMAYDRVLGFRGTSSVFYPGLSTADAIGRARGEGHSELGPDDERPLRQSIDEIAWLLGTQFTVQVVPSSGTGAAAVLAGATDTVFRQGQKLVEEWWCVRLDERADVVLVAIDADCAGHGWDQLGAALATARNLVIRGGKVIVLSELSAEPGDGMTMIRQSRTPRDALQPIRKQAPLDMIPATQLATVADWAEVYLLSKLSGELVDELAMTPLDSEREVQRLLERAAACVFVESAQHTWGC